MDKRLIFRYRSRMIKSRTYAGRAKPIVALELLRLTVQMAGLRVSLSRRGKVRQGRFGLRLPPRKVRAGMSRAPVPQTDTGGRA